MGIGVAVASLLTYITVAILKQRKSIALTAEDLKARKLGLRILAAVASLAFVIITSLVTGEPIEDAVIAGKFDIIIEALVAFLGSQGIYLTLQK